ncbi:PIN domain-containing protein [Bacillaceae bacterium IKA-2]|nr:PIN domain-containing protein [Bacillaceae bacterium IKA-2]
MEKYIVFFDTNAIMTANYRVSTPALREFFRNTKHQLVISRVCIDETVKNFHEKQSTLMKSATKAVKDLTLLGYDLELNVKKEINFSDKLLHELNEELSTLILEKDFADFDFIYAKSLKLRKPFKEKNGKEAGGFRDNIIWSSYIEYLKGINLVNDTKIIFVNNDGDFVNFITNNQRELAQDLKEDLLNVGIQQEQVIVVSNLRSLNEEVIQPLLPKIQTYSLQLRSSIENFLEVIVDEYESDLESRILEEIENIMGESTEPYIDSIEPYRMNLPQGIRIFKDGTAFVYFTQTYLISFQYYLQKSDYFMEFEERKIDIYDADWNNWVMLVGETWFTNIGYEVVFDISDVDSINIIEAHMHDEINVHPEYKWDSTGLDEE